MTTTFQATRLRHEAMFARITSPGRRTRLIEDEHFDRPFQLNDVDSGNYVGDFATRRELNDFIERYGVNVEED